MQAKKSRSRRPRNGAGLVEMEAGWAGVQSEGTHRHGLRMPQGPQLGTGLVEPLDAGPAPQL